MGCNSHFKGQARCTSNVELPVAGSRHVGGESLIVTIVCHGHSLKEPSGRRVINTIVSCIEWMSQVGLTAPDSKHSRTHSLDLLRQRAILRLSKQPSQIVPIAHTLSPKLYYSILSQLNIIACARCVS